MELSIKEISKTYEKNISLFGKGENKNEEKKNLKNVV